MSWVFDAGDTTYVCIVDTNEYPDEWLYATVLSTWHTTFHEFGVDSTIGWWLWFDSVRCAEHDTSDSENAHAIVASISAPYGTAF